MSSDGEVSRVVHAAKPDFFISYTKADEGWGEWIAWELEDAGYTTFIQKWDFKPAQNFVELMDDAIRRSKRLIAVFSTAYLRSGFGRSEWTAALAANRGTAGTLIPVRVEAIDLDGLMRPIIYIDLVEQSEADARETLLSGVRAGRGKPAARPAFPGHATSKRPPFPGNAPSQGATGTTARQRYSAAGLADKRLPLLSNRSRRTGARGRQLCAEEKTPATSTSARPAVAETCFAALTSTIGEREFGL